MQIRKTYQFSKAYPNVGVETRLILGIPGNVNEQIKLNLMELCLEFES